MIKNTFLVDKITLRILAKEPTYMYIRKVLSSCVNFVFWGLVSYR